MMTSENLTKEFESWQQLIAYAGHFTNFLLLFVFICLNFFFVLVGYAYMAIFLNSECINDSYDSDYIS